MYWQKQLNRENPDKELEDTMLKIREEHKAYDY